MPLKLLHNFLFSSCPFLGVMLTLPMSLHVFQADVSSLPYAKCGVGCGKPLAFPCLLCEENHDADGGGFFLLIFWVRLGFFYVFPYRSMLLPGCHKGLWFVWQWLGVGVTPSLEGPSPELELEQGGQRSLSSAQMPEQSKSSSGQDKSWNSAVSGQYRACALLLLMARITFTEV